MAKLTKAQRQALTWARDDGALVSRGFDARPVRRDVIGRLYSMGLLSWRPGHDDLGGSNSEFVITEAGRSALQSGGSE